MISVKNLVKRYGAKTAVDDLSFEVDKGEIVGFLGPNGAGKSTTLRILSGFLGMTSGKVSVAGHDIKDESFEARRNIGYMPEAVPIYPEMRVAEYLAFRAELKRVARKDRRAWVDDAMKKANVDDVANVLVGNLSKGYRQRVGLADALVARPPLLVLDEPTAGLDPNQIREVRDVVKELAAEHTVLLSTHILSEVEASCSRVIVIDRGKLVAQGTMEELRKKRRASALALVVRGDEPTALAAVRGVKGVAKADAVSRVRLAPGTKLPQKEEGVRFLRVTWEKSIEPAETGGVVEAIVRALVEKGIGVRDVTPLGSSLEDLFAELTRAERADDDEAEA